MKTLPQITLLSFFFASSLMQAAEAIQLPEGKAIKLEIETSQTTDDHYYSIYPDRSKSHSTATFNNTYLSDGNSFSISVQACFGSPPVFAHGTTVAYDGSVTYALREPESVLTMTKGPLNLISPHTGERIQSPFHSFYSRNPLIAMFSWQMTNLGNEAELFSFNRIAHAYHDMSTLLAGASQKSKSGKDILEATAKGYDPFDRDVSVEFLINFDKETRVFSGWRAENASRTSLKEFTVHQWMDFDCGNGKTIQLPERAVLTYSSAEGKPGEYQLLFTWELNIVSAALIDATHPGLFKIDPSGVKAIYDPKTGSSVPVIR